MEEHYVAAELVNNNASEAAHAACSSAEAANLSFVEPSTVTEEADDDSLPSDFLNLSLSTIITALYNKESTTTRGGTTTLIPKTYKHLTWGKMNGVQRNKVLTAWRTVPSSEKNAMVKKQEDFMASATYSATMRAPQTTADDRCRLIHMLHDCNLYNLFSRAHTPLDRSELDRSADDQLDSWCELAKCFNDYATYNYTNIMTDIDVEGKQIVIASYQVANDLPCKDYDPCLSTRPPRDGTWLKTQLREFKSQFTVIYSNFMRSGNQDAEFPFLEFKNYINSNSLAMYCFMLYGGAGVAVLIPLLGKMLPDHAQADSGVGGDPSTQILPHHQVRKRRRSFPTFDSEITDTSMTNISCISSDARSDMYQSIAANADSHALTSKLDRLKAALSDAELVGLSKADITEIQKEIRVLLGLKTDT